MPRTLLKVAWLGLVACSPTAALQPTEPQLAPARPPQPAIAGGKGFVAPQATPPTPPFSLTASDGSGLRLVALDHNALVEDPIAHTELDLQFRNPKANQVEGKFEIRLPPGAMVTRFAMRVAGKWQEGEVVARAKGRETYESILHNGRDPALLEQETGNRFSARVFPIAPNGQVELKVSYVQTLAEPKLAYRAPLRGLPEIGRRAVEVRVKQPDGSVDKVDDAATRGRPLEDFVVPRSAAAQAAWRMGKHAIARVTIPARFGGESNPPKSIVVLFDTSASRASGFAGKVEQLSRILQTLQLSVDPATRVTVIPFDQAPGRAVFAGPIAEYASSGASRLLIDRRALGASDVGLGLASARKYRPDRIVLVTDGMITAGAAETAALRKRVAALSTAGVQRLDVVAGNDNRDDAVLQGLVSAELPHSGVVIDADTPAQQIAMRILRPTAPPLTIKVRGAKRVWPERLRGVQAGDAVLVFADLPKHAAAVEVELISQALEPESTRTPLAKIDSRAFEAAFVQADVREQLRTIAQLPMKDRIAKQRKLTALSVEHRVLNDLTALLVLETERDYARFDITRRANKDVLVLDDPQRQKPQRGRRRRKSGVAAGVSAGRVQRLPVKASAGRTVSMEEFRNIPVGKSSGRDFTQIVESSAAASRDTAAAIRLSGTRGAARIEPERLRGGTRRRARLASATLKTTSVRGRLSKSRAREVGRRHSGRVEDCYHRALLADGEIKGKITVEVSTANGYNAGPRVVRDSTGGSHALQTCIVGAVQRMGFGNAGDVASRVRLTFALKPGALPDAWEPAPPPRAAAPPAPPRPPEPIHPDRVVPPTPPSQLYTGKFAEVMRLLREGKKGKAAKIAWGWRDAAPADVMALVAVGEVSEAFGRTAEAARIYGSIAELHPSQAPMRRFAAGRLERLGRPGLAMAIDSLREAKRQRPDHPSSHRSLAWALARKHRYAKAFDALLTGYRHEYPGGRFASTQAELADELAVIAAAWIRSDPKVSDTVHRTLAEVGLSPAAEPSLRFVLTWETDANDVDLHVVDAQGRHASYQRPTLNSGGLLLADVTTGFGPESFVIQGEPAAYPYDLKVHYYRQGPMGFGMGQVQIIRHDGAGKLDVETRPFVAMKEDVWIGLGRVRE